LFHWAKGGIQRLELIGAMNDQEKDLDIPICAFPQELFSMMGSDRIRKEPCFALIVEISTALIKGREENSCGP
jgi:hypothetical protein